MRRRTVARLPCGRRRDAAEIVVEEPSVVGAAREDSAYSLFPVARQPLAIFAGADRVTVRVVAESSRREARVSKIPVPNKEHERQESRRDARDEWSPRTHCNLGLGLSLNSSKPTCFSSLSCLCGTRAV